MSNIAITMMVIALVVIWGGFIGSVINLLISSVIKLPKE